MSSENLLPDLYGDSVDHDELLDSLVMHFGGARHDHGLGISYPGQGRAALTVIGDDDIEAVHPGPAFAQAKDHPETSTDL